MTKPIIDLTLEQLTAEISSWGEAAYRGRQVWGWIYQRLASDFALMTDLPAGLRERLAREFVLSQASLAGEQVSEDRYTRKAALRWLDGEVVETVLMRYSERNSVCVSTQVGCPVGCVFCATGQGGFRRNLTAPEIVEQVLWYGRALARFERKVTHVVFMGMGEPFLNYDATWHAVEMLTDPAGFGLGGRHISISTVGVVPGIRRMASEHSQVGLAVSLHAVTDGLRDRLVPMNRKHRIGELLSACRDFSSETGRRVTFEYALIDRVNDSMADAAGLAALLDGMTAHVNLIPLNPTSSSQWRPSPREAVETFRAALAARGIACTVRMSRGTDIQAACGQLRSKTEETASRRRHGDTERQHDGTKPRRQKDEEAGSP